MKTFSLALQTLMVVGSTFKALAQGGADIVWSTNAHYAIYAITFSSNASYVASAGGDGNVNVWSTTNGNLRRTFSAGTAVPLSVALSSDARYVFVGMGRTRMWRLNDGGIQWQLLPGDTLIYDTAFSPDDLHCVDVNVTVGSVYIRNTTNGAGVKIIDHDDEVYSVAFSRDGTLLASGSHDQTVHIARVSDTNELFTLIGHYGAVNSVDFSPDGKLLATAGVDGTARLWNTTNGVCELVIDGAGGRTKFSANGQLLLSLDNYVFKLWRVSTGQCVGSIANTSAVRFDIAKNGKYFAYGAAGGDVVLARLPIVLDSITRIGNETILNWQGGSGLYQLQSNTNFTTNGWQNVGSSTTNTCATNLSSTTQFFRVQSLPNP